MFWLSQLYHLLLMYIRETFEGENVHEFRNFTSTHESFVHEILSTPHSLCKHSTKCFLPTDLWKFSPSKVSRYMVSIHHRWNDPDNKVVTDKIVSEVKGQFPQFSEGDIKGKCCQKPMRIGTIIPALFVHTASCKRYFQTLCQREKRKDKLVDDQLKQRRKQRKIRVSSN